MFAKHSSSSPSALLPRRALFVLAIVGWVCTAHGLQGEDNANSMFARVPLLEKTVAVQAEQIEELQQQVRRLLAKFDDQPAAAAAAAAGPKRDGGEESVPGEVGSKAAAELAVDRTSTLAATADRMSDLLASLERVHTTSEAPSGETRPNAREADDWADAWAEEGLAAVEAAAAEVPAPALAEEPTADDLVAEVLQAAAAKEAAAGALAEQEQEEEDAAREERLRQKRLRPHLLFNISNQDEFEVSSKFNPSLSMHVGDEPAAVAKAFVMEHEALFNLTKSVAKGGGWREIEILEAKIIKFHEENFLFLVDITGEPRGRFSLAAFRRIHSLFPVPVLWRNTRTFLWRNSGAICETCCRRLRLQSSPAASLAPSCTSAPPASGPCSPPAWRAARTAASHWPCTPRSIPISSPLSSANGTDSPKSSPANSPASSAGEHASAAAARGLSLPPPLRREDRRRADSAGDWTTAGAGGQGRASSNSPRSVVAAADLCAFAARRSGTLRITGPRQKLLLPSLRWALKHSPELS